MLWSVTALVAFFSTLTVPVLVRADDPARPGMCEAHQAVTDGPALLWPSNGPGPHKTVGGIGASRGNPGTSGAGAITIHRFKDGRIHHSTGPMGFAHPIQDCVGGVSIFEMPGGLWDDVRELSQGP